MSKVIVISLILGLLLIIFSFKKRKFDMHKLYTSSKKNKILNKALNFTLISALVKDSSNENIKKKLKLIYQCKKNEAIYNEAIYKDGENDKAQYYDKDVNKILRNVYLIRIVTVFIVFGILLTIKLSFNDILKNQLLDTTQLYTQIKYSATKDDIDKVKNYIGNDYINYFEANDNEDLTNIIYSYAKSNKLNINYTTAKSLTENYYNVYLSTRFSVYNIILIISIAFMSNFFILLYIHILYRIYSIKQSKEFSQIELIAIIHMNREELNIYEILKEVNKYCVYLKPYMTRCLNKYNSDPAAALDNLTKEVEDKDFTNFIKVLKSCLNTPKDVNTNILALQRKLRYITEKIEQSSYLEKKVIWLTVSSFPLIMVSSLDLILPFISNLNFNNSLF